LTVAYGYVDTNGKERAYSSIVCARSMRTVQECMQEAGVARMYTEAHLPNQFWRFQLTEAALFLLLSGGVFAIGLAVSRRRLT
jgi:hypothetical protein